MASADDEWQARAKVLRENVEHHVKEEENELFDKADDVLSDEEIEDLGNRMEAEKARKQGRPAPKTPDPKSKKKGKAAAEPGMLTKIAEFVGLSSRTVDKRTAKKSPVKTAPRTGSKSSAKTAARKSAGKSASAVSTKRSTKGKGSTAVSLPGGSSKKKSGSAKKAKKK